MVNIYLLNMEFIMNTASYFENEKQIDDFISAFQKRKEYEEFKFFDCKQKWTLVKYRY